MELEQLYPKNAVLRRKIFIEESLQDPHSKTTYIRQVFAEENYGHQLYSNNISIVNGTYCDNDAAANNKDAVVCYNYNFNNSRCDNFCEEIPMEVDFNSSKEKLINTIRKIEDKNAVRKRKNKFSKESPTSETFSKLVSVERRPLISNFSKVLLALTCVFILLGVYVIIAGERFIYVNKKALIENLRSDLKETLLYQEEALKVLIKNIERMESWNEGMKVLPLIGTTGVGKTFTANIIKKHFFPQLVHEITNLNEQQQLRIINNLNNCCCNLIIIDNLKASDLNSFLSFVEKLPKLFDILIIPIFNIHDTADGVIYHINKEDFTMIRDKFDTSNIYYDFVIYDELAYNAIEKWLRNELHKRKIEQSRHETIVRNILNRDSVKYKGFKSLDLKLLLSLKQ